MILQGIKMWNYQKQQKSLLLQSLVWMWYTVCPTLNKLGTHRKYGGSGVLESFFFHTKFVEYMRGLQSGDKDKTRGINFSIPNELSAENSLIPDKFHPGFIDSLVKE